MKILRLKTVILLSLILCSPAMSQNRFAADQPSYDVVGSLTSEIVSFSQQQEPEEGGGGFMAGLKALVFGPRIGIETNDGIPISFVEKANVFVPLVPFQAYSQSGVKGFLASAFLGPRVGTELNNRKIRFKEWVGLVPVVGVGAHLFMAENPSTSMVITEITIAAVLSRLWPALDAFRGKTMNSIVEQENLRRQ